MSLPRVLLVEDDPSLQRFVEMALDGLPLSLHCCARLAPALEALRRERFALIVTDLLLPDGSGQDLMAQLQAEPALRGDARIVVFSAGLDQDAGKAAALRALGAWQLLPKPCSLDELEHCVQEGLRLATAAGAAVPAAPPAPDPVHTHFGGNAALYQAFRASCLQQFAQDCRAGDAACTARDAQALRRLAHSLKSVLLTLGLDQASAQAAALEHSADAADWAQALPQWQALRLQLDALR